MQYEREGRDTNFTGTREEWLHIAGLVGHMAGQAAALEVLQVNHYPNSIYLTTLTNKMERATFPQGPAERTVALDTDETKHVVNFLGAACNGTLASPLLQLGERPDGVGMDQHARNNYNAYITLHDQTRNAVHGL